MLSTSTWYNKKSGKIIETVVLAGFDGLTLEEYQSEIEELIKIYGKLANLESKLTEDGDPLTYISFEREELSNETAARINRDNQTKEDNKAYKLDIYIIN